MFSPINPSTPGTQSLSSNQPHNSFASGKLVKAKLKPVDANVEEIEFQFNPETLSFSRSIEVNKVDEGRDSTSSLKKISFAGPKPTRLTISNITFDTYEQDNVSVKTYTDKLMKTLDCSVQDSQTDQKRPPLYIFMWGTNRYLRCFVESLDFKITMFMPDGRPVRAVANLTLVQVEKDWIGKAQQSTKK